MKRSEIVIDFHTHTSFGDGDCSPTKLIRSASGRRINAIGITDHNATGAHGDRETRQMAEKFGVAIISGMELSALAGHFLILGIAPKIIWEILKANKCDDTSELVWLKTSKLLDLCWQMTKEGAVIIPAHPGVIGGMMSVCLAKVKEGWGKGAFHGVEIHNGVTYDEILGRFGEWPYIVWSNSVRDFANKCGIPTFGNSDAHFAKDVGRYLNVFSSEDSALTVDKILESIRRRSLKQDGITHEIRKRKPIASSR